MTADRKRISDCQPIELGRGSTSRQSKTEDKSLTETELQRQVDVLQKVAGITQIITLSGPTTPIQIEHKKGDETQKTLVTLFNETADLIQRPDLKVDSSDKVPKWFRGEIPAATVVCAVSEAIFQSRKISDKRSEEENPDVKDSYLSVLNHLTKRIRRVDSERTARFHQASRIYGKK